MFSQCLFLGQSGIYKKHQQQMEKASPLGPSACCSAFPEATAWAPLRGGAGRMDLRCSLPGGCRGLPGSFVRATRGHLVERQAANVTENSRVRRLGAIAAHQDDSFRFHRERDFRLLRTESGRENLCWKDQMTPHCENRRYYGTGMAACKASLPAGLAHFQNRCVGINLK